MTTPTGSFSCSPICEVTVPDSDRSETDQDRRNPRPAMPDGLSASKITPVASLFWSFRLVVVMIFARWVDLVGVPVVLVRVWLPGFGSRAVHDGWLGLGR